MLVNPNRDRVAERRESTRREILAAAWEIAREQGLAALTLRDVAARVGMRAPSLYNHFASKDAIYDAMFRQAWEEYDASLDRMEPALDEHPRVAMKQVARHFFGFAAADLPRYQLMNQPMIPGFEPSPESYEPAVRVFERGRGRARALGIDPTRQWDLFVTILTGLANQHHANDPCGSRFADLLDEAVDMLADAVGLPPST